MLLSRKIGLWIALFLCAGTHFATAADAPAPAPAAATQPELVTLNMRDADIRAVTQWIAEQTHKQIVIDPRVQGRVTALADHPVTVAQAYQVFLAILEVHGYATSDVDGIVRIYPAALGRLSPKAVVDDFSNFNESGQVMHIAALKNVPSANLVELVKPLVSANGYIAPLAESNSLIIADDSSNVKRLLELIQRMDRVGSLEFDVIKLQHASARDIAKLLESLAKSSAGGREGGADSAPLSIAADERSNSVLLTGDPVNRQRSKQLILQLDRPLDASATSRVIFLKFLSATEIVPILKNVTNSTQKESKEETVRAADISIEASKSSNAVVMSGPPALLDSMQDIIAKLDVQRAQVLVEAVIVELDEELTNELGVQWRTDFQNTGFQAGTNFGLQNTTVPTTPTAPLESLGNGLTLGYYDGGSLRALLHALSAKTGANILSTPSIMALDNQQAQIVVGSNIPLITGQATSSGSTTADPFTTYERKDIGVTLKITPQVNSGDSVTLDIVQEVQSIADSANFNDIVTNKRSITTKVLVNDDRTIVLGGLISNQQQNSVDKVPILGDLPLIGKLFSSTSSTVTKQNLMVFIHPVIIDSAGLARDVSQARYEDMRVRQIKYEDGKMSSDIGKDQPVAPLPEFESISPRQKTDSPAP